MVARFRAVAARFRAVVARFRALGARSLAALLCQIPVKVCGFEANRGAEFERTRKRRIGPHQCINMTAADVQKLTSLVNRPKLICLVCSVHVGLRVLVFKRASDCFHVF